MLSINSKITRKTIGIVLKAQVATINVSTVKENINQMVLGVTITSNIVTIVPIVLNRTLVNSTLVRNNIIYIYIYIFKFIIYTNISNNLVGNLFSWISFGLSLSMCESLRKYWLTSNIINVNQTYSYSMYIYILLLILLMSMWWVYFGVYLSIYLSIILLMIIIVCNNNKNIMASKIDFNFFFSFI